MKLHYSLLDRFALTLRTGPALVTAALTLLWSGCGTVNRQAAGKLALQGAATATTASQTYQSTGQSLTSYVEGEYLLSALKPGYSPPSGPMLANIKLVQAELGARQQLFQAIASLYTSFGNLCSYDAKGQVEQSLGAGVQAVNGLSKAVGGGAISDSAGKLAAAAGGEIVGQVQSARIKDASAKIRAVLSAAVFVLQKASEHQAIVAAREEITRGKLKVARSLWDTDLALATDILSVQVQAYGLTPNDSAIAHASANPNLKQGVNEILQWRQAREQSAQEAAYNATIRSLQALSDEHVKIEKGESVNLLAIQGYLAEMTSYADLITAARKGK